VAFRAAASNTTGSGSSVTQLSVTVPASGAGGTVAAGDLAYLAVITYQSGLLTNYATPAGWTELFPHTAFNSNTTTMALCWKILEVSDLGASLNFGTLTSARRQSIGVIIYSDAAHDSNSTLLQDTSEDVNVLSPTIDPTADDCILVHFAFCNGVATDGTLVSVAPTAGWDERVDAGTSAGGAVENGTLFIQDRQESGGGPFSAVTATASEAVDDGQVMVAVAPVASEEPAVESSLPRPFVGPYPRLLRTGLLQPFQLRGDSGVVGDQAISLSDTGTASDTLSASADVPLADTAAAADALSVSVAVPLADLASATDLLSASAALTLSDAASGTDALSVQMDVVVDPHQAGIQIPRFFQLPSAASIQLRGSQEGAVTKSLTDTAAAADAATVAAAAPLADTASAADSLTISVTLSLADTATAAETIAAGVPISLSDTGTATDTLASSAAAPLADTAAAADALSVSVALSLSDTATAADALVAGVPISLADTGSASDTLASSAAAPLSETSSAADTLNITASLTRADTASAADVLSVSPAIPLTDIVSASEGLTITVQVALVETASGSDLLVGDWVLNETILSRVSTGPYLRGVSTGDEKRRATTGPYRRRITTGE
jgi:hypothetical protein